ncbi:MAG: MFS transporter [Sphingomicrobium sp.]
MTDQAPRSRYATYAVAVLIIAYTLSYVDRTILTLMVKPIRASLHISDVQLSLLHGLAFAIFYTFMGVPIGRLTDTRKRTTIIATGIGLWSIMTTLCGFARSFGMMFGARIGVGVGEAALSPAAYSIMADSYDGKRLVRALSVYQSAIYLGPAIATAVAGLLLSKLSPVDSSFGHFEPWQQVFMIIGLPGLLVALLVLTIREPLRRGIGASDPPPGFAAVLAHMKAQRGAYFLLIAGLCFQSVMWNGAAAWIPTNLMRSYGWTPADVAVGYAPVIAIFGVTGTLFGGWLAGVLRERGRTDSNVLIAVIAAATALPFGVIAPLMPTATSSLVVTAAYLFCGAMPYGGAAAAFQEITPNRMRGQVSAIYLFFLNLAGIGLGGTVVALVTAHVFGGDQQIGRGISLVVGVAAMFSLVTLLACRPSYRNAMIDRNPS